MSSVGVKEVLVELTVFGVLRRKVFYEQDSKKDSSKKKSKISFCPLKSVPFLNEKDYESLNQ